MKLLFDPYNPNPHNSEIHGFRLGDREPAFVYDYEPQTILAVNIAIATGRPLLIRGLPGTGKSSLAPHVAKVQGWRYYAAEITSRTQAQDLLWRFDSVRRLADAQAKQLQDRAAYLEPGVLWWAFDRELATRRGLDNQGFDKLTERTMINRAMDPANPNMHPSSVVLLDEIDKADPDVPNNLLGPLGSYSFRVEESTASAIEVSATSAPLVIITTNEERELPRAFLRRCIVLNLEQPPRKRLLKIAQLHFPEEKLEFIEIVADLFEKLCNEQEQTRQSRPSTAEFLDAIAACQHLDLRQPDAEQKNWEQIATATLRKPPPRDSFL